MHIFKFVVPLITTKLVQNQPITTHKTLLNNLCSLKYNICYEYYIEKKLAVNLYMKYHYSEAGIRKILKMVNKKIKELNK